MKKLQISVITCVLTLLALSLNTAALTFDANIYQHYNYSSAGKVVATPAGCIYSCEADTFRELIFRKRIYCD